MHAPLPLPPCPPPPLAPAQALLALAIAGCLERVLAGTGRSLAALLQEVASGQCRVVGDAAPGARGATLGLEPGALRAPGGPASDPPASDSVSDAVSDAVSEVLSEAKARIDGLAAVLRAVAGPACFGGVGLLRLPPAEAAEGEGAGAPRRARRSPPLPAAAAPMLCAPSLFPQRRGLAHTPR